MTLPTPTDPHDESEVPVGRLPAILVGTATPDTIRRVECFYESLIAIFEAWVTRCESPHTRRAYRQDVVSLIAFPGIRWPEDGPRLLTVPIADVQDWRATMLDSGAAPKTLNRRISSVSSFYKFVQASAAELRLPITVPNPAHAQFIARSSTDSVHETKALSATRARQLMSLPQGDTLIAYRDRASTTCRDSPGRLPVGEWPRLAVRAIVHTRFLPALLEARCFRLGMPRD